VRQPLDVVRNLGGMQNLGRPPSVLAKLDPHDLTVERQPARLAAVAVVKTLGGINLETFWVQCFKTFTPVFYKCL
jgi:hypothetical protein